MNVYGSSTEIVLAAVGTLSENVLAAIAVLLSIAFGFLFLFWLIMQGQKVVIGHDFQGKPEYATRWERRKSKNRFEEEFLTDK